MLTLNKTIPAGDCFKEEWFFVTSNEQILQRVTSDFLQRATSVTSNERVLQLVTSDFLQRATSATINEKISERAMSDILQRVTSATSNEQMLQQATSDFTTSNEQRVKSYASWFWSDSKLFPYFCLIYQSKVKTCLHILIALKTKRKFKAFHD